ncbi:MAG: hypothetical protein HUU47_08925 [Bacteroidetes bacterium]|nr:hypothetical protein [Bacteroidota bacterium]
MSTEIITYIRLLHIVFGTIWVGSNIFMALFIYPAVKRSGSIGGQFMSYLPKTNNMPAAMTISGFITIVTGVWVIYYMSEFRWVYFTSSFGMCILIGGILAVIAFLNGVFYIKPKGNKIDEIANKIAQSNNPPSNEDIDKINSLSNQIVKATNFEAVLLSLCLILMGLARYI